MARTSEVNHIDETSFANKGKPQWLWVMTNTTVAFLMIHPHRSKEAFETLIRLITLNRDRPDEAGTFARRLHREMDYRWLFPIREAALLSPTMGLTFSGFSSDTHQAKLARPYKAADNFNLISPESISETKKPDHLFRQPGYLFQDPWLSVPTSRWV